MTRRLQGWRRVLAPALLPLLLCGAAGRAAAVEFALSDSGATLKLGGYAKVDFIQDFDPIGDAYQFKVNSIPVEGGPGADQGGRTTIHARQSRLNLTFHSGSGVVAFLEGDFFGDKNAFRLRHAYGEVGSLLGGQTWTTFMDITTRPPTIDYEGPDGEVYLRQGLIRWTQPLSEHWTGAVGVENPTPEFAVPAGLTGAARSNLPDVVVRLRGAGGPGHLHVAGVVRQVRFDGEGPDADQSELGYGGHAALGVNTGGKDKLIAQFTIGNGLGHYIEGVLGTNSDAVFDSEGRLRLLRATGAVLAYTRHWSATLRSGVAWSRADVARDPALGAEALRRLQDFRLNVVHTYAQRVELCGEVLWGRRENQDGAAGEAVRLQLAVLYSID